MAETHTPEPSMQDGANAASSVSSPMTAPRTLLDSGEDGGVPPRAADTPLESSPAPTGFTIETTKKRKRVYGRNVADEYEDEDEDGEEESAPKRKKGKARKVGTGKSKKGIDARVIPRTLEECEDIDKKLISMRDGGASWPDIRKMWRVETGEESGKSTLPNRYMRLKVNFTVIDDKDNALLLKAHREVEGAFEKERWSLISKAMTREGSAEVYLPEVLQRQFKKLMHQGANLRAGKGLNDGLEEEEEEEEG